MSDVWESVKNCDGLFVNNENGLALIVVGAKEYISGAIKIDPLLNI